MFPKWKWNFQDLKLKEHTSKLRVLCFKILGQNETLFARYIGRGMIADGYSVYVFTFIISTGDLYEISYFTFRNIDAI